MSIVFIEPHTENDQYTQETVGPMILPCQVHLEEHEAFQAAMHGVYRQVRSVYAQRKDTYSVKDGFTVHIIGAIAEMVLSMVLDKSWPLTVDTFHKVGDVGNEEARGRPEEGQQMVLKKTDFVEPVRSRRTWLICGSIPNFVVVGWCRPRDVEAFIDAGTDEQRLIRCDSTEFQKRNPPTRWFVPVVHLNRWIPKIPKTWEVPDPQETLPLQVKPQIQSIEPSY